MLENGLIKMDDSKVEAIKNLKVPQTKRQCKSILGLMGYYRSHIRDFGARAYPLTELLHKSKPDRIQWGEKEQAAFDDLKACLLAKPCLWPPDHQQGYVIQSDASQFGVGATLLQRINGEERAIAYASRKLLPREQLYSTIERELLAVTFSLQKFEQYVYGREIRLETDHKPLLYLMSLADKSSRVARWALLLQRFDIHSSHLPGKLNVVSDALSRL